MPDIQSPPSPGLDLRVFQVRDRSVMLDGDLAALYGVSTGRLNEQVKRNLRRFPEDFLFQLTRGEARALARLRSQNATLKRGQHIKHLPHAFTEHGAIMAATILRSDRAVTMSVYVVRAFIRMRRELQANAILERRLRKIEDTLLVHDAALREVYGKIKPLLVQPEPEAARKEMGFHVHLKKP